MTYRIRKCRWQFGAAITLPTPWGPTVYVKQRLPLDSALYKHEAVHVKQIEEWGTWSYLWRHVWARLRTLRIHPWQFDMYVKDDPVEAPAYAAQGT